MTLWSNGINHTTDFLRDPCSVRLKFENNSNNFRDAVSSIGKSKGRRHVVVNPLCHLSVKLDKLTSLSLSFLTGKIQIAEKQEELQSCSLWKKNHIHRKTDKMKRQRTMYQMKEQYKTPKKQQNEVEIGNLPEK